VYNKQFWIAVKGSYPKTTEEAFRILIPFVSTCLCEPGFFAQFQIKNKLLRMTCIVRCPKLYQQLPDRQQERVVE